MMPTTQYAVFALTFAASAAAPGPEIAAILGRALSRGLRGCASLAVGIVVGKLLMLTAAIAGLAALVAALGPAFTIIQYCGAAYLVYLGIRRWRRAGSTVVDDEKRQRGSRERAWTQALLGLGLTLSNPIAIAFYMALLPGVVDVATITLGTYLVLAGTIVVVMALNVTAWGLAAEMARKVFAGNGAKVWINRIAGAMFVAAGVWVAIRPLL